MNQKALKRSIFLMIAVLVICSANVQRMMMHSTVRNVEFISILALGMAIGGLLFSVMLYFRMKRTTA